MPIFIIYDRQMIWPKAYTKFDDAVKDVSSYLDEVNACAKKDGFYELEDERPAKMEEEISQKEAEKDSMGGVMVAWNELNKIAVYVKELEF